MGLLPVVPSVPCRCPMSISGDRQASSLASSFSRGETHLFGQPAPICTLLRAILVTLSPNPLPQLFPLPQLGLLILHLPFSTLPSTSSATRVTRCHLADFFLCSFSAQMATAHRIPCLYPVTPFIHAAECWGALSHSHS